MTRPPFMPSYPAWFLMLWKSFQDIINLYISAMGAASWYIYVANVCHQKSDYGLAADASHEKSPCDGLGGTTETASLQATIENKVFTAHQMFDVLSSQFCPQCLKESYRCDNFLQIQTAFSVLFPLGIMQWNLSLASTDRKFYFVISSNPFNQLNEQRNDHLEFLQSSY